MLNLDDSYFMKEALKEAQQAADRGDVPIGAVVVVNGKIIGRGHNQIELLKDATAHAEMIAITQAEATIHDWRLEEAILYSTKEPCMMCMGAAIQTRISKVIFGAWDPKKGTVTAGTTILEGKKMPGVPEIVGGILVNECSQLLARFFKEQVRSK